MRVYMEDHPKFPKEDIDAMCEAYGYLEKFLSKTPYLAGEHLTIADLCCVCTVTSGSVYVPINEDNYPKVYDWIQRISKLPYYETTNGKDNGEYLEFLKGFLKAKNGTIAIETC